MSAIYFDKWVHTGIFAVLTYAAGWTWNISSFLRLSLIFLCSVSYGIIVELIQDHFVANRSFDWGDWVADGTGAVIGLIVWQRRWEKIDPCRNRGRNQN
jgi:VanZ family protein